MTFSEFAKMLYPIIGGNQTTSDFILCLTNQIIDIPDSEPNEHLATYNNCNLLSSYSPDTLTRYYNGSRNLSNKIARSYISKLDSKKFEDYLSTFPNDVTDNLIAAALKKHGIDFVDNEAIDACTNLFVSILEECANKHRNHSPKITSQKIPLKITQGNLSLDEFAQLVKNFHERRRWEDAKYIQEMYEE